ncbi:DNA translocase FtsK [Cytobacillus sp. NCCP-133]|uniref:DNA translocase FtsK n=1 Tax=Cytobacillus sp. NCCP-133 TaxID=766848 RepID=UPI00222FD7B7|nr:DNA translocase FtsK [Cytobacillus sp. NCCP-133]GLB58547.1 hypothetical protein NCCP133_06800 [Cytobacillus sp. NCCP-133]
MSWIKKLFHMFKNDEDEYENIEEYADEEVKNLQLPPSKSTKDSSRDVDAKVVYQYPKGQFRFPVIPDNESEQENGRPRPRPRPVEKREQPDRKPEKRQPRMAEREQQRKPAAPVTKEERPLTRNEREAANKKRPFQPTEIPSPIYGFKRPRPGASINKPDRKASEFKPSELTYDEVMRKIQQMPPKRANAPENVKRDIAQEETISEKLEAFHAQSAALETDKPKAIKYLIGEASNLMFEVPEENSETAKQTESDQTDGEAPFVPVYNEQDEMEAAHEHKSSSKANISDLLDFALQEEEVSNVIKEGEQEKNLRDNEFTELEDEANAAEFKIHFKQAVTDVLRPSFEEERHGRSAEHGQKAEFNSIMDESSEKSGEMKQESNREDLELAPVIEETSEGNLEFDSKEVLQVTPEMDKTVMQEEAGAFDKEQPDSEVIQKAQAEFELCEEAMPQATSGTHLPADSIVQASPEPSDLGADAANAEQLQAKSSEVSEAVQKQESAFLESEKESFEDSKPAAKVPGEKMTSSRGHIPFNVIMLNNDRKKLNHQRQLEKPAETITKSEEEQQKKNKVARFPLENIQQTAAGVEIAEDHRNVDSASSQTAEPVQHPASQNHQLPETDGLKVITQKEEYEISYYAFPSKTLLTPPVIKDENSDWLYEQEQMLNSTLKNFNVRARVVNVTQGPSVTRFEVQPEPGVKVNKITNLSDDIKLSLAAKDIRIEAPIPGKHTIGIEVPNQSSRPVLISEIINTSEFQNSESPLTAILGLDISGMPIVTDLRKMPHGLIAGATGSGKSVCINTILVSLLYKASPDELKLLLIDPKMVELAPFNRIPHLVSPVITDVKAATAALKWAVEEMERRYELFAHAGVRDINRFNELAEEHKRYSEKLPFMVIVIDELADLMMMSPADVEEAICRIAQKARACGIHLIIATQRPSVDVITGLIKANVPTRIAFSVSSQVDSRTIIDIGGAEKLLGRGDMLFLENGSSKPVRLQGTFVSDSEIDDVVAHVRREGDPDYLFEQEELLKKAQIVEEEDELFFEACEYVVDQGATSTSSLQRRFKIGYNRAARLIDMMEKQGFISENRGSKPRDVLITQADLESLQDTSTLN